MISQTNKVAIKNGIAVGCLLLGWAAGLGFLGCGFTHHIIWGFILMAVAFGALIAAIVLAISNMNLMNKQDDDVHAVLSQMMEEGSLRDHLRRIGYK